MVSTPTLFNKKPKKLIKPILTENNNKFTYTSDKIYRYDYSMHVKTEFSGSGQNTSDMHLIAALEITFPKKCEGLLKIHTIELRDRPLPEVNENENEDEEESYDYTEPEEIELHEQNDKVADAISRYELRFAFHDGVIGEVCAEDEEPTWVLNFKKGLLSAIQNTMHRFDIDYNTTETDVSGTCNVVYELNGASGTSLLIKKTKDIVSCKNRYKTQSILQTTPYDFRQNYAAWPILTSESYCNVSSNKLVR